MYDHKIMDLSKTLSANTYPGRGIVMGVTKDGQAAMLYFIMGRSENSRNRVFVKEGEGLRIEPFDVSKVSDPTLIIYRPVRRFENSYIVTNGDQTDTVYDYLQKGLSFSDALSIRQFEPDAPNFTPRISGLMMVNDDIRYTLSILKKQDTESDLCARQYFEYTGQKGLGHLIHTYEGDGNPLPSFAGEPGKVHLPEAGENFVRKVWQSLDENNRISLYARFVSLSGEKETVYILNRHQGD